MDRTINWGDDAADARYRTQDTSSTGGDLVLAEDLDGGTVLLEYDYSASEWVSRGPVNLSGNDITNVGSISADTLEAEQADTRGGYTDVSNSRSFDTVESNDTGSDLDLIVTALSNVDGSTIRLSLRIDGITIAINSRDNVDSGGRLFISATIPVGSSYEVAAFGSTDNFEIDFWSEQS